MTLKDYILIKLEGVNKLNIVEKKRRLENIYSSMEKQGYIHYEIFAQINEILIEKIRRSKVELNQQIKKMEK